MKDPDAVLAFKLMNQSVSRAWEKNPAKKGNFEWRGFQLAFIFLGIESFVLSGSKKRKAKDIIDLLYFPTGGGKTEAYLGLISFCALLQRIKNERDCGVVAVMRYTLRLLTVQQFQRALRLICSLDLIRENHPRFKNDSNPFSIAMWVGGGVTPNKISEANDAIHNFKGKERKPPDICSLLKKCPWCNCNIPGRSSDLESRLSSWKVDPDKGTLDVFCPNEDCEFTKIKERPIPVFFVDEVIYKKIPTLVIATVDKMAQLAHKNQAMNLFRDPPKLIIQDEIHLLTGPLGTAFGIFEALLNNLWKSNPPKYIAATATQKGVENQAKKLFQLGKVEIFPPMGLNYDDNFWAKHSDNPADSRFFIGVPTYGNRQTNSFKHLFGNNIWLSRFFMSQEAGFNLSDLDPYWTPVSYFQSFRDLGQCMSLLDIDVPQRIRMLNVNLFDNEEKSIPSFSTEDKVWELTSNQEIGKLPAILNAMATPDGPIRV